MNSNKPCKNVAICGTQELEAPSSLKLGICLKCRGFYKATTEKEQKRIWYEGVENDQ